MEINERQFIKGFNSGYFLAKYEPEIINVILKGISPVNSYISGMVNGRKKFELEHANSHLNELLLIRKKSRDIRNHEID